MKQTVIGQTGSSVLSDKQANRRVHRERTVRYQYSPVSGPMLILAGNRMVFMKRGWMAWVCGPFHSDKYGACGLGLDKKSAKAALQRNLTRDYRYLGHIMLSDVDESDTVGDIDPRLLDDGARNRPITITS